MAGHKPELEEQQFADLPYARRTKDRREALRGAVALYEGEEDTPSREIPGFPHIRRVYRLAPGVHRLFKNEPFVVEEKLDGYNVRVFRHQANLLACTRGGFICPFTSAWARIWAGEWDLEGFLDDHPEHALCGEVINDNPYHHQRYPDLEPGAHFHLFEIVDPDGAFLPPEDRYALADRYALPQVPRFGRHDSGRVDALYELLRDLDRRQREGIVMKALDAAKLLKFVTPASDINDIRDSLEIAFDLPGGFFHNRWMRVAMSVRELGLDPDEYARRLGAAFLEGCPHTPALREASQRYVIHLPDEATWEQLYTRIAQQVKVRCERQRTVCIRGHELLEVTFSRLFNRSSSRFYRMLHGHLYTD